MRYLVFIIAFALIVGGAVIGYIGGAPINHPAFTSLPLMIAGGVTLAFGVALLLIVGATGSSETDKPEGLIRP